MNMRPLLALSISLGYFTTACFGYASRGNGVYYGGGGVGLFVIILVAALLLGRKH